MKLLTIAVPAYNVENTLGQTLDSLCIPDALADVEVIVVDDGSQDKTPALADEYARRFPQTVCVIHKPNGGHGSAVNAGIDAASGMYFKVVDGDDRLAEDGYQELLAVLRQTQADLVASPYKKVSLTDGSAVLIGFQNFETGKTIGFESVVPDGSLYFDIHSMTLKTSVLRDNGIRLQEKTFYVDMEFALLPVPLLQTVFVTKKPLYLYYIGNSGQSVSTQNFVRHFDDHARVVNRLVLFSASVSTDSVHRNYLYAMLAKLCFTHYMLCVFYDSNLKRGRARAREFDAWLKKSDGRLYRELGHSLYLRSLRATNFVFLPKGGFFKKCVRRVYTIFKPATKKRLTY